MSGFNNIQKLLIKNSLDDPLGRGGVLALYSSAVTLVISPL
jgi:hypothetical protein